MQAGQLDRKIKLLRYSVDKDTAGGTTEVYTEFAEVWASVKDTRGRTYFAAQQDNQEITTVFRIRYRDDLNARDRIKWKNKQYEIIGTPKEVNRNDFLDIMATARDELQ